MTVECRTFACSSNGDHTILYYAVVGALPFKYTESVSTALNGNDTALAPGAVPPETRSPKRLA
jgi:hypothetical protein